MAVNRYHRLLLPALLCLAAPPLRAQDPVSASAEGVNVNLVNVDLRSAVQMLAQYMDAPVYFGEVGDHRITFTSPRPVPRSEIAGIIRNLSAQYGYTFQEVDGGYQLRRAEQAQPAPQPQTAFPAPGGAGGPSLASANGMELFVIRLRHARAADVAATVNLLYGRGSAVGEIGQRRGTLNDELNANRVAPYGQPAPQVAAAGAQSGNFAGEVVIVPDFRTNALLVRAARADYELIRAAVEQVDVRPLQVLIEATVAFVRRDFTFAYGLQATTADAPVEGSANTTIGGGTTGGAALSDLVIRALNLGGIDLDLVLRAGETRNNVVILDRPLILAANNEEAEIVVGEQRPFVQVQRSTDGGVLDEVVQYKDVGTTLRVLPTISADGFVQLEVTQEVNSASTTAVGIRDAPVINTRSVSTELLVRDGFTAVLGGLSGSQRDRTSGGIPFLSDIPLIGGIFGRKFRKNDEYELFVFITPHVLYSDEDMQDAADRLRTRPNVRGAIGKRPYLLPGVAPADSAQAPAATPTQPGDPVPPPQPASPVQP